MATAAHCILPAKMSELLVYLGELDTLDTGEVEELAPAELHRVIKPNWFCVQTVIPDD